MLCLLKRAHASKSRNKTTDAEGLRLCEKSLEGRPANGTICVASPASNPDLSHPGSPIERRLGDLKVDSLLRTRLGIDVVSKRPWRINAVPETPQAVENKPCRSQGLHPARRFFHQGITFLAAQGLEAEILAIIDKGRRVSP